MSTIAMGQLNEQQQLAVNAVDGPVLVFAGAGSGKTRVLTQRIVHMVLDCNIPPYNILAITFTNKAANEMKQRLLASNCRAESMYISTIHSMCALILRYDGDKLGYTSNFSIYTDQDKERAIKRIMSTMQLDDDTVKDVVLGLIGRAKSSGIMPAEFLDCFGDVNNADRVATIYSRYQNDLFKSNSMDFDDLLTNVCKLFTDFPEVLAKYQSRYKYISVDEFQDINKVQYDIITMLAKESRNLFVVGDDDQSIYSWRGADVNNILNFSKMYPDAKVFKLEQNYRSTKRILSAANRVINCNTKRVEKQLWTENDDGVKVDNFVAYNESEEANYCIQQILGLVKYNGYKFSDFAILMRVNALSRSIEQECLKYGIDCKIFGGYKFFERKEVKDLVAYLRVFDNPRDNEAIIRVINVPKRGIGETTVDKLKAMSDQFGLPISVLINSDDYMSMFNVSTATKLKAFAKLYNDLLDQSQVLPLNNFVVSLIKTIDYENIFKGADDEQDKLLNISEFLQSVIEFCQANEQPTLQMYLQSVTLVSDIDVADGNYVTVATIHAVKGLEFRAVFIIGLEEGLFPINRATFSREDLEEERRLMYVATTRAKERLYLTRTRSRFLHGHRADTIVSRFYKEVEEVTAESKAAANLYNNPPRSSVAINQPRDAKTFADITTGTKVLHKIFGKGTVLAVKDGNADVVFDSVGVKTLALKFAPITIVG